MSLHPRRAVPALVVLALLVAGCGSDSSNGGGDNQPLSNKQYSQRAEKVSQQFFKEVQQTQTRVAGANDAKSRAAALDGFKRAFTNFADRIEKLSPPKKAKADQATLVAKVRESAGDIDQVRRALDEKSQSKARAAFAELQRDVGAIRAAISRISAEVKPKSQ